MHLDPLGRMHYGYLNGVDIAAVLIKLPPNDPKRVASEYDARLSRIDAHLRANREILDKLPH